MPRLSSADDVSFLFQSYSLYVVQNRFLHPSSLSLSHIHFLSPFQEKGTQQRGFYATPKKQTDAHKKYKNIKTKKYIKQ